MTVSNVSSSAGSPVGEMELDYTSVWAFRRLSSAYWAALCIFQLAELGVADALSADPEDAAALAEKVGANADVLRRVLHFVATHGVFIEEADGRFGHSDFSRLLRTDHPRSQRAWFRLGGSKLSRSIGGAIGHTLRTGRPAPEVAAPEGIFGYLSAHPEEAVIFNQAMESKSDPTIVSILKAYAFSRFDSIADIGGGKGHFLAAVLNSAPNTRGVLFDLPYAVSAAANLESERLALHPGDFFKDPLPVCDAYTLMNVIHDWSDESAIAILRAVRRAAPPHSVLLLLEADLPAGPGQHPAKFSDILMLGWSTGHERTAAQYEELLAATGFRLCRIIPASPEISIFEAVIADA